MASHPHDFGRASALPLPAVLASIPSYPRPVIERLVTRMIEHLDAEDGDPDEETNGDELDFNGAEDDFGGYPQKEGLSYAPYCEDDEDDDSDHCLAGDDGVFAGPVLQNGCYHPNYAGSEEDAEIESWPTIGAQSEPSQ